MLVPQYLIDTWPVSVYIAVGVVFTSITSVTGVAGDVVEGQIGAQYTHMSPKRVLYATAWRA